MKNTFIKGTYWLLLVVVMQSCNSSKTKENQTTIKTKEKPFTQIATGQVDLYDEDGNIVTHLQPSDSLFGQDANYPTGKKMAYVNNGDGTITDVNSGLMWQEIPTSEGFDWQSAKDYAPIPIMEQMLSKSIIKSIHKQ